MTRSRAMVLCLSACALRAAAAQQVQVRLIDSVSAAPVAGAVLTLRDSTGRAASEGLSNAAGQRVLGRAAKAAKAAKAADATGALWVDTAETDDTVPAHAAALAGRVRDIYGHPLAAAVVRTDWPNRSIIADDSGAFLLRGLPPDTQHITAQRIGYAPVHFDAILSPDSTLFAAIRLERITALPAAKTMAKLTGRSALLDGTGFYDRQAHQGFGYFITPDEIANKPWALYPAQFIADAPGVMVTKRQGADGCGGGGGRGAHGRASSNPYGYDVQFRTVGFTAGGTGWCVPNVFVDGTYTKLSVDEAMGAENIYAIEIYLSPDLAPARFQAPMQNTPCGSLVIWTKKYAS